MTTWRPAGTPAAQREPVRVAASLDRVTRFFGAPPAQVLTAVFARWEQLVGPEIAAHAAPKTLRNGALVIVADQPAWATQLRFLATDLLTRIQAEVEASEVTKIEIRTGPPGPMERRRGRVK